MNNYVFGPVPSRRLGRSLGIDLVPFKTCSYDCIYCQLGRTTCKTVERKEWVPLEAIAPELKQKLAVRPDYLTLSGSGEPTLYSRLGDLIDEIKKITDIPIAVLTNGSLLWQEEVQRQLMRADLVIPSLDAGDETQFQRINRPHESVHFEQMLAGLIQFRRRFRGHFWLEVFLVGDDAALEAKRTAICRCTNLIRPDRVQLNTVSRPPAEESAIPAAYESMKAFAAAFAPPAEIIADFHGPRKPALDGADRDLILALLRRRPCSLEDIAGGMNMHPAEISKTLGTLCDEGLLEVNKTAGKIYFRPVRNDTSKCPRFSTSKETK